MSTAQVAAIETADIAVLKTSQITALTTAGVVALTTEQVVALTTAQMPAITTAGIAAMTTSQIAAIETVDIAVMKTAQIFALTTSGIASLTTDQVSVITTAGIATLKTSQIAALTTDQVVALTSDQISVISTANFAILSTTQLVAIETADIAVLKTSQLAAISTSNISALTTDQIGALTTTQVESLSAKLVGALTTDQVTHLTLGTPIILDLNGDGVKTQSYAFGVNFDLFATGQSVQTGWVSSGDGLLVLDRNHDGKINDGSELFGSATTLASGSKADNGYDALRELDSNHDGVISQLDAGFKDLSVWVDSNSDGVSESSEIKSLMDLHIAQIGLTASVDGSNDNGNIVGLTSSYQTTDGATHAAADVWFVADKAGSVISSIDTTDARLVDQAIAALATVSPQEADTMKQDLVGDSPFVASTRLTDHAVDSSKVDLRTRVSSLASAMGSFETTNAIGDQSAQLALASNAGQVAVDHSTVTILSSMTDAMKSFDLGANLLQNKDANAMMAVTSKSLNLPGAQDPLGGSFLALGTK
jgi:hypothetical protein